MTPENLEPEETPAAPSDVDAGRSAEPSASAGDETARPASTPDPAAESEAETPQPEGELEPEAAAADEPEAATADEPEAAAEPAAEAEAPKRARRPRRRRGAEASTEAAEGEADTGEPAAEVAEAEAEAEAEDEAPAAPARPAQPAPTRRRSRRQPGEPAPVVRAQAKYVRSSARKARLVCDHIRGKSVEEARAILAVTPRAIARDWTKLLESAIANAEHNHELVGEDLYVKAVHADEGPTIKRFRPRAMGRATAIRKRTSHLTILLTPKD
jgi:ribosomal protein L22